MFLARKVPVLNEEIIHVATFFEDHLLAVAVMVLLPRACVVWFLATCDPSVLCTVGFPSMYSLNFCVLNTIANISFSMGTQFSSDVRSLWEAYATGLP